MNMQNQKYSYGFKVLHLRCHALLILLLCELNSPQPSFAAESIVSLLPPRYFWGYLHDVISMRTFSLPQPMPTATGYTKGPWGEEVKVSAANRNRGNCSEQDWKDMQQRATKEPCSKEAWTLIQMPDQKDSVPSPVYTHTKAHLDNGLKKKKKTDWCSWSLNVTLQPLKANFLNRWFCVLEFRLFFFCWHCSQSKNCLKAPFKRLKSDMQRA